MAQDVERHCRECVTCQKSKLPMPMRSPLTNIPIGRPWQIIVIDILEVPVSTKNSRYLLVIQDYFTKWADARPLPDRTAIRITAKLVKLFCTYGIPEIVHSDQGRNFESSIVQSTLDAFGVQKSHTTPYHPQGDGMVERFNHSLLQLCANICREAGGLGTTPATGPKVDYDRHSAEQPFKPGDLVWLSVPTAGKLNLQWEGNWTVRRVKSPVTVEISDGEPITTEYVADKSQQAPKQQRMPKQPPPVAPKPKRLTSCVSSEANDCTDCSDGSDNTGTGDSGICDRRKWITSLPNSDDVQLLEGRKKSTGITYTKMVPAHADESSYMALRRPS
ncbi:hypothetical protein EMCRGX_G024380 [Ephydatia muelleri]